MKAIFSEGCFFYAFPHNEDPSMLSTLSISPHIAQQIFRTFIYYTSAIQLVIF
jgi:hypothetical protein